MSSTATNKIITEKYDVIETIEGHYSSHSNEKEQIINAWVLKWYYQKNMIYKNS
jgi:hypothetical protein